MKDVKIREPADVQRRLPNSADIYAFLSCYFPDVFWGDWTDQRREMVAAILNAARYGGDQTIAAPRGEGKTSIVQCVTIYCVMHGILSFPPIAAATGPNADQILANIKFQLKRNQALADDYPEICDPTLAKGRALGEAREPYQVFGTLHGPGYSGGQSYGKSITLDNPVSDDFHVFAVEWQPDKIVWTIDGTPYFTATPDDPFLQGKQWVFNHPFFILLNVAVGGNFGGAVSSDTVFPQSMSVDYVRLYQTRPKPVVFNASFKDDFKGWKQVSVPFSAFKNEDGYLLDTTSIQTLRFTVPDGLAAPFMLDQIKLLCPNDVTVTSSADSGVGSLRNALNGVCAGSPETPSIGHSG